MSCNFLNLSLATRKYAAIACSPHKQCNDGVHCQCTCHRCIKSAYCIELVTVYIQLGYRRTVGWVTSKTDISRIIHVSPSHHYLLWMHCWHLMGVLLLDSYDSINGLETN